EWVNDGSKLMWDQHQQQWTFILVYEKSKVTSHENQVGGLRVCSLDPGVRTFMTWYSSMHGSGCIGNGDAQRLVRLCFNFDNLISRRSKLLLKNGILCTAHSTTYSQSY
ncbi:2354_t:CDS:2, partial [Ambispora gerdemannii]